jgi:4a-hydroxytetrahydrobiopterin dehydratase
MEKLTKEEVLTRLEKLSGWSLKEEAIEKKYEFSDFKEALAFINQIGEQAEEANHHPEFFNVYNKVSIRLNTHDADGITEKDFDLAKKIDELR